MLENLAIYGLALGYMLVVAIFALACVRVMRWIVNKLEEMIG